MQVYSFNATGTIWNIQIFEDVKNMSNIQALITSEIDRLTRIFSRFNRTSELNQLGEKGVLNKPSNELRYVLEYAEKVRVLTNNIFTPFIGFQLTKLGYGNQAVVNNLQPQATIQFNIDTITVPKHSVLDLGSCAKGYIVDRVADLLKIQGIHSFLINAGGDIYLTSNKGKPIEIVLNDGHTDLESIAVTHVAICTSNNTQRQWKFQGSYYSHIQNQLMYDIVSVSVMHHSCFFADLLSTVLFITYDRYREQLEQLCGKFEYAFTYKHAYAN